MRYQTRSLLPLALCVSAAAGGVAAQEVRFDIPAQELGPALRQFARQASLQVVYEQEIVDGLETQGVEGSYEPPQAMKILIAGASLAYELDAGETIRVLSLGKNGGAGEGAAESTSKEPAGDEEESGAAESDGSADPRQGAESQSPSAEPAQEGEETEEDEPLKEVITAEIVVTATKRGETRAQDVAVSLTAFDEERLERLNVVDFDEFIVQVPGTNFIDNGGPGRGHEVSSIRGLSPVGDNTAAVVAQYLDGSPRFGNNYRLFDIGEISVLRGPQGTLWGSQAIGGLISYRSNRPDLTAYGGHFEADVYDSKDVSGLSNRVSGHINIPVIKEKFGLRLAGHYIDEEGYIDNVATGSDNINDVEESAWRLSALFRPNDSVTITGIYHGNDLTADASSFFNPELGDRQTDVPFDDLPADQEYDLFNFIIDADLGWAGLSYTASYFDLDNVFVDGERNAFGFIPAAKTFNALQEESWTHELRLASRSQSRFGWVIGLYYDDLDQLSFSQSVEFQDPTMPGTPPALGDGVPYFTIGGPQSFEETAIFGELTYDFTDQWQLLVGGRYFDWQIDNDQDTDFLGTSFGQETGSVGDQDDFFKVQLNYQVDNGMLLFATRSEGFRIGGFNPFVGPNFNSSLDFLRFSPDRLINYELGFKSAYLSDRLVLNAALYQMDWEDVQTVVFDSIGVFAFTANASDLDAEGFEIELGTQDLVARGFYANASYTYNDNEFREDAVVFPGVGSLVSKGERLRRTPRNMWALDAGQDFVINEKIAGYARANYWHKDRTTTEGFNRNDGAVPIPAQDVVNASAGVYVGNWEIRLALENLTDATPLLQVFSRASTATGSPDAMAVAQASSIRPRTLALQFRYGFSGRTVSF